MNEYCKVCKYWNNQVKKCEKNWEKFCEKKDFIPSLKDAVLNLLIDLEDYSVIPSFCCDEIENYLYVMEE